MTEIEQYVEAAIAASDEIIEVIEKKKEALREEDLGEALRLSMIVASVTANHERVDRRMYETIHGTPKG